MSKIIWSDEDLPVHWHNKRFAVVKTYGLLTGNMYQLYKRIDKRTWERRPKNGIELFKTIKAAREYALGLSQRLDETTSQRRLFKKASDDTI